MKSTAELLQPRVEEDTDSYLENDEDDVANTVACYFLNGSDGVDGVQQESESKEGESGGKDSSNTGITYDARLGLAIETVQTGVTMDQLWRVI